MAAPSPFGGIAPTLLAIAAAETLIGTILVFLRIFEYRHRLDKVRWSLGWNVLAWALGVVLMGVATMACLSGLGNQTANLRPIDLFDVLYWSWVGIYIGLVAVPVARFSIIALLLGVLTPTQRKRRIILWTVVALTVAVGITQMTLSLVQCMPIRKLWMRLAPGQCDLEPAASSFGIFQGVFSAIVDLFLALYPVTIVYHMQASFRTKFGFCALMACGAICGVAACARAYYTKRLESHLNPSYDLAPFLIWCFTELWLIIILGSIPPLRPLFMRWFRNVTHLSRSAGSAGSEGRSRRGTGECKDQGNEEYGMSDPKRHELVRVSLRQERRVDSWCSEEVILGRGGGGQQGILVSKDVTVEAFESYRSPV